MQLLLIEGTAWPGMGPPGRGPLRPPRPACSPRKLRANREVPVRAQDGGTERLRMDAKVREARAPAQRCIVSSFPEKVQCVWPGLALAAVKRISANQ
ncbi:hypothetical protein R6Z07F_018609 [Ovis aries]